MVTIPGVRSGATRITFRQRTKAAQDKKSDLQALRTAVAALEHPGLAARLAEIAGKPIELVGRALPETASKAVAAATTKALDAALSVAFRTMKNEPKAASSVLHKALAATSGAVLHFYLGIFQG